MSTSNTPSLAVRRVPRPDHSVLLPRKTSIAYTTLSQLKGLKEEGASSWKMLIFIVHVLRVGV